MQIVDSVSRNNSVKFEKDSPFCLEYLTKVWPAGPLKSTVISTLLDMGIEF